MNAERYCDLLNDIVVPYFTHHREMYFQQDGASSHFAINVRKILDTQLTGRWIGRRGPTEWPARSPDLTPLDYWLWPHLKSMVFRRQRRFESLNDLTQSVRQEIEMIPLATYRDSMRNFQKRIQKCIEEEGGLFEG